VCPPSGNEPHKSLDMEDMEDTEVHRDDSREDMEGEVEDDNGKPSKDGGRNKWAPSVVMWIRMESERSRTRDRVPNGVGLVRTWRSDEGTEAGIQAL
jgi:hypothetical protein